MFGSRILPVFIGSILLTGCSASDMFSHFDSATNWLTPSQEGRYQKGGIVANEDVPFSWQIEASDADLAYGDRLSFSVVSLPDWLRLSRDGILKGTANNADVGTFNAVLRVTDRAGKTDDAEIVITVLNTNDAPNFTTSRLPRAVQDAAYEAQILAEDDDLQHGDQLRFKATAKPEWVSVSKQGMITGTPKNADVGEHMLSIELSDRAGVTVQKDFKIQVENVNDAPVIIIK